MDDPSRARVVSRRDRQWTGPEIKKNTDGT
jgi:hypothetical protein